MTQRRSGLETVVGLAALVGAVVCLVKGAHVVRHLLRGVHTCDRCGKAGDLEDMGLLPDGRVDRTRAYSRENGGTFLRGDRWLPQDERARKAGL